MVYKKIFLLILVVSVSQQLFSMDKTPEEQYLDAYKQNSIELLKNCLVEHPDLDINQLEKNHKISTLLRICGPTCSIYTQSAQTIAYKYALAQLLFTKKVSINPKNKQGETPLHLACSIEQNGYINLTKLLIQNGANTTIQNKA